MSEDNASRLGHVEDELAKWDMTPKEKGLTVGIASAISQYMEQVYLLNEEAIDSDTFRKASYAAVVILSDAMVRLAVLDGFDLPQKK